LCQNQTVKLPSEWKKTDLTSLGRFTEDMIKDSSVNVAFKRSVDSLAAKVPSRELFIIASNNSIRKGEYVRYKYDSGKEDTQNLIDARLIQAGYLLLINRLCSNHSSLKTKYDEPQRSAIVLSLRNRFFSHRSLFWLQQQLLDENQENFAALVKLESSTNPLSKIEDCIAYRSIERPLEKILRSELFAEYQDELKKMMTAKTIKELQSFCLKFVLTLNFLPTFLQQHSFIDQALALKQFMRAEAQGNPTGPSPLRLTGKSTTSQKRFIAIFYVFEETRARIRIMEAEKTFPFENVHPDSDFFDSIRSAIMIGDFLENDLIEDRFDSVNNAYSKQHWAVLTPELAEITVRINKYAKERRKLKQEKDFDKSKFPLIATKRKLKKQQTINLITNALIELQFGNKDYTPQTGFTYKQIQDKCKVLEEKTIKTTLKPFTDPLIDVAVVINRDGKKYKLTWFSKGKSNTHFFEWRLSNPQAPGAASQSAEAAAPADQPIIKRRNARKPIDSPQQPPKRSKAAGETPDAIASEPQAPVAAAAADNNGALSGKKKVAPTIIKAKSTDDTQQPPPPVAASEPQAPAAGQPSNFNDSPQTALVSPKLAASGPPEGQKKGPSAEPDVTRSKKPADMSQQQQQPSKRLRVAANAAEPPQAAAEPPQAADQPTPAADQPTPAAAAAAAAAAATPAADENVTLPNQANDALVPEVPKTPSGNPAKKRRVVDLTKTISLKEQLKSQRIANEDLQAQLKHVGDDLRVTRNRLVKTNNDNLRLRQTVIQLSQPPKVKEPVTSKPVQAVSPTPVAAVPVQDQQEKDFLATCILIQDRHQLLRHVICQAMQINPFCKPSDLLASIRTTKRSAIEKAIENETSQIQKPPGFDKLPFINDLTAPAAKAAAAAAGSWSWNPFQWLSIN
jgi:hypothetical protein